MALYAPVELLLLCRLLLTEPGTLLAYPRVMLGIPETLRRRRIKVRRP